MSPSPSPSELDPDGQSPLSYTSAELKILVVEDDAPLLQLLGEILRAAGHFASLAQSSAAGLAQFPTARWDLVCTNRDRTEMSGDAFAREIKRRSPETPVVMVTRRPPLLPNEFVDAVLLKPFTCADLGAVISRCLKLFAGRSGADGLTRRIVRTPASQACAGIVAPSLSPKAPL